MSQKETETGSTITLTFDPPGGAGANYYTSQLVQLTAHLQTTGSENLSNATVDFNIEPATSVDVEEGIRIANPADPHANGKGVPVVVSGDDLKIGLAKLQAVITSKAGKGAVKLNGFSHNPAPTIPPDTQVYNVLPSKLVLNGGGITGVLPLSSKDGHPQDPKSCFAPVDYYIGAEIEGGRPTLIHQPMVSKVFFTAINADLTTDGSIDPSYFDNFNILKANGEPVNFIDDYATGKKLYLSEPTKGTFPPFYVCPKANKPLAATLYVEASGETQPLGDLIVADLTKSTDTIELCTPKIFGLVGDTLQIPPGITIMGITILPAKNGHFTIGGSVYVLVNKVLAYYFVVTNPANDFPGGFVSNASFPIHFLHIPISQSDPPLWNEVNYIYVDTEGELYVAPPAGFYVQYSGRVDTDVRPPTPGNAQIAHPFFPHAHGQVTPEICYDGLHVEVNWAGTPLDSLLQVNDVLQVTLYLNGYKPGTNNLSSKILSKKSAKLTSQQIHIDKKITVHFSYADISGFSRQRNTGKKGTIRAQYKVFSGPAAGQLSRVSPPISFTSTGDSASMNPLQQKSKINSSRGFLRKEKRHLARI